LVFAADALKGAGTIWAARAFGLRAPELACLAPCVVAGHIWPAPLGFRGGKGLVTALGALIGLDWRFLPAGLLAYFAPLALGGKHPRAARILSGVLPMTALPFLPFPAWDPLQAVPLALASGFVLWAHRSHAAPTVTPE
jgi:glycerol-3-phosphate acyltransferase PlsY